ncbi:exosortase H-associated membrane protein, partial [Thiolapillus sp.]
MILKTLLFKLDPGLSSQLGFSSFQKELVALGYQFGYLILPA